MAYVLSKVLRVQGCLNVGTCFVEKVERLQWFLLTRCLEYWWRVWLYRERWIYSSKGFCVLVTSWILMKNLTVETYGLSSVVAYTAQHSMAVSHCLWPCYWHLIIIVSVKLLMLWQHFRQIGCVVEFITWGHIQVWRCRTWSAVESHQIIIYRQLLPTFFHLPFYCLSSDCFIFLCLEEFWHCHELALPFLSVPWITGICHTI